MAARLMVVYEKLLVGLGGLAGLVLSGLAILITADVLMRNVGTVNFPWLLEVTEYALFVTTFIAAPWVLSRSGHVRVDLVIDSVPPRIGRILEVVADVFGLAVTGALGWYGLRVTIDGWERGDLLYKQLVVPEWWLMAVIPFGCTLLAIEFARRLWRAATGDASDGGTGPAEPLEGF